MENKIKIVYIILGIQKEAISFTLIERINYIIDKGGFEISVVSEHNNDESLLKSFRKEVRLYPLNISKYYPKKRLPVLGYYFLKHKIKGIYQKTIDEIQPDLITVINLESFYLELIPILKSKAKTIIEFRGTYLRNAPKEKISHTQNEKLFQKLKKKYHPLNLLKSSNQKIHNKFDYATVLTKENFEDRKTYLKIPIKQIFNFSKIPKELNQFSNRENIILSVGRMTTDKNFIDLIDAVNLIDQKLSNWVVHIYGNGREIENLKSKIKIHKLEKRVFLKGFCTDMDKVYNQSKLLISTSLSEGFGLTMVEALSYKIPVIAYNCKCGPKEIVKDGVNGYLIDFSVQELAQRILELTSDSEKLESFSSHCYDEIDRFDFKKIMNQWIEFYESVVKNMS